MATVAVNTELCTTIEPRSGFAPIDAREIWRFRELLLFLAWRDLKVRYKQTALGVAWVVLPPVLTTLIFTVVFGRLAKIPSDGAPYELFAFVALLPWRLFADSLSRAGASLVNDRMLISKVYFPRLIIPIAATLAVLVDFLVSLTVLALLLAVYGVVPSANALWLPAFFALAMLSALGMGFWLSALNVKYRDFGHTIPFMVQFWMYASPIAYSTTLVPESWRTLYALNPMVSVVDGFRWGLLGTSQPAASSLLCSVAVAIGLFVTGAFYFRRVEREFADII